MWAKYIIITSLIFFINENFYSQNKIESTFPKLNKLEQVDTLLQLCWNNRSNEPQLALYFGFQAMRIINSKKLDDKKSTALNFIGVVYRNIGKLDSAYYYYKSAYIVSVTNKDKLQTAYSLTNLGDYYTKNALYSTALEKLLRAYKLFKSLDDERGLAYCLNYIGEIYFETKDYSKANYYLNKSAELRKQNNDIRGYAKSLLNISKLKYTLGLNNESIQNTIKALKISREIDYKKGISESYSHLADIYFSKGILDSSLLYRNKAIEIDLITKDKYSEIENYNALGSLYLHNKNSKLAKEYLWKAEEEARNTKHFALLLTAFKYLTELSVFENNYKAAFVYQKKFLELNDKLFGEETRNKIADLQTAFAIERKDRENEKLKLEVEREIVIRNFLFITFALSLITIIAFVSKYKTERKNNLLLKELNENKDKFFAIISHDLKNPFSAILSYSEILDNEFDELTFEDKKEIISNIKSASQRIQLLLNDLLTWATAQKGELSINKNEIVLKPFLTKIVESFELLTRQKGIKILIDNTNPEIIIADKFILQTIINNLINNAIKFSHPRGKIIVQTNVDAKNILFSVIDSGVGIEEAVLKNLFNVDSKISTPGTKNERGTGLGLKICYELSQVHGGNIIVKSEVNKGSTFTFSFPMEK